MSAKMAKQEAQNPLILRANRLMEAFTKSDDERDFYLDRMEGFIVYIDLDKPENELAILEKEIETHADRYCVIPKLTFYEAKKIMEGFVDEKVYDIDTKEKLLDIIQSKEARENFLEFIYDHHSELEKWQQYYQERSRIRIIEWLRNNHFHFVFEEDLDLSASLIEKLKRDLFITKPSKDILIARKALVSKAKTYYSSEALNPRPKRGRPPKQAVKLEIEPQVTTDIYTTVPSQIRPFLFIPDISSASSVTFSSKFGTEEQLLASRRQQHAEADLSLETINQKLASLRSIASKWVAPEKAEKSVMDFDDDDDDAEETNRKKKNKLTTPPPRAKSPPAKLPPVKKEAKKLPPPPKPKPQAKVSSKVAKKVSPTPSKPPKRKLAPLKKITPKFKGTSTPPKKPIAKPIARPQKKDPITKTVSRTQKRAAISKSSASKKPTSKPTKKIAPLKAKVVKKPVVKTAPKKPTIKTAPKKTAVKAPIKKAAPKTAFVKAAPKKDAAKKKK